MNDHDLAIELITRLNALCVDASVRKTLSQLLKQKVAVFDPTVVEHPTIQVSVGDRVGFLGMLNGIVGVMQTAITPDSSSKEPNKGVHDGYGYISAVIDDDGELAYFTLTK